mgnify:CR=1 FL=1
MKATRLSGSSATSIPTATGRVRWRASRALHFELDFLEPEVTYEAAIYADAPDADWRTDPTACDVSVRYVTSADAIDVVLAPGGGQAISFLPL